MVTGTVLFKMIMVLFQHLAIGDGFTHSARLALMVRINMYPKGILLTAG